MASSTGTKMANRVVCREASHAGSWHTASGPQLTAQLEGWLSQAQSTERPARAITAPRAGSTSCGSCAVHAYKQVDPSITRSISIRGPSHHVPLSRCALSVWIYIEHLCMTFVLTQRFTENYGRRECLNACLCRQMKMNTVLKCICLIQLKPWKGILINIRNPREIMDINFFGIILTRVR